jgi:hypothetical protein
MIIKKILSQDYWKLNKLFEILIKSSKLLKNNKSEIIYFKWRNIIIRVNIFIKIYLFI